MGDISVQLRVAISPDAAPEAACDAVCAAAGCSANCITSFHRVLDGIKPEQAAADWGGAPAEQQQRGRPQLVIVTVASKQIWQAAMRGRRALQHSQHKDAFIDEALTPEQRETKRRWLAHPAYKAAAANKKEQPIAWRQGVPYFWVAGTWGAEGQRATLKPIADEEPQPAAVGGGAQQ